MIQKQRQSVEKGRLLQISRVFNNNQEQKGHKTTIKRQMWGAVASARGTKIKQNRSTDQPNRMLWSPLPEWGHTESDIYLILVTDTTSAESKLAF